MGIVHGEELVALIPEIARLRILVFAEYPYLYAGTLDYESAYLKTFVAARDAIAVTVMDDRGQLVGCSTASALDQQHREFYQPLADAGYTLSTFFYLGESVLAKPSRGQGIGHAFFDAREQHARARGYQHACFCAVERPEDHPLKPHDYRPHDNFWRQRGYRKLQDVSANFTWPETDGGPALPHAMAYWLREL